LTASSLSPKVQAPQFKMPNAGNWIGITAIGVAIAIAYITVKATIHDWNGGKTVLGAVILRVAGQVVSWLEDMIL